MEFTLTCGSQGAGSLTRAQLAPGGRAVGLSGGKAASGRNEPPRPLGRYRPRSNNQPTIGCVAGGFRFAIVPRILSRPGPLVLSAVATPSPSVVVGLMVSVPAMVMMSAMR